MTSDEAMGVETMDRGDFESIAGDYAARVRRYVAGLLGDAGQAEDVTQEVLARVQRGWATVRAPEARTTWIFRIASNLALDHLRSRAAREARRTFSLDAEPGPGMAAADAAGGDDPSAEDRLEQGEMAACLREHVDRLSPPLRATLILRDLEGPGERAVAEILGCSVAAVKVRTHRARRTLRGWLQASCGSFYGDARGVFRCAR